MRYISFGWTAAALLAGAKTVTRRTWTPRHAAQFGRGMHVYAYDKLPHHGGQRIAVIMLTQAARLEPDALAPDSDYDAEGFAWCLDHWWDLPATARRELGARGALSRESFDWWRQQGGLSTVIRFKLERILDHANPDLLRLRPAD